VVRDKLALNYGEVLRRLPIGEALEVADQALRVKPARKVDSLASGASLAAVESKLGELISVLRSAGFISREA
jgi:hypothetical protein